MRVSASPQPGVDATPRRRFSVSRWTILVVSLTVAAWLFSVLVMGSMDEGPWTPLHGLPMFLVSWVVMLTAMMLPSELNYIGAFASVTRARGLASTTRLRRMGSFIGGYGVAWIAYGALAFMLDRGARLASPAFLRWDEWGAYLAGAVLIAAGFYQISSLKHACLSGCRSPLSFFGRHWREGNRGALVMGFRHGLVCVGCCWGLMAVMFAVGAMSLTWMAILTVFMFSEKIFPGGHRLAIPIAAFLWIMGFWIVVAPATAPLLKLPLLAGGAVCG